MYREVPSGPSPMTGDLCQAVHVAARALPRVAYPFERSDLPRDGIYLFFEAGEYDAHTGEERIVRVGTNRGTRNDEYGRETATMDGTGGVTRFRGVSALMGASPRSAAGMSNQWVSKAQEQPHFRRTHHPAHAFQSVLPKCCSGGR